MNLGNSQSHRICSHFFHFGNFLKPRDTKLSVINDNFISKIFSFHLLPSCFIGTYVNSIQIANIIRCTDSSQRISTIEVIIMFFCSSRIYNIISFLKFLSILRPRNPSRTIFTFIFLLTIITSCTTIALTANCLFSSFEFHILTMFHC